MLARRFELQEFEILEKSVEAEKEAEKAKYNEFIARRKKRLAEAHRIRLLEIENMKLLGADESVILEQRYQADLRLAQGNAKAKLAVDLRYQNQRLRLQQEADAKAEAERQKLEAHRRNFLLESQAFDISMMKDGLDKELSVLELKYRRERELKQHSEEELTELTRRFNIERQAIEERSVNKQIQRIGDLTSNYAAGFAEAAYGSLAFGESAQEAIAGVIGGLGRQAAVEALVESAKGFAALVVNPAAAAGHFFAAAKFGAVAAAAGAASSALGGGGGGGGVSASPTSPTGSPQIAPTTEREQAESSQMVFNINFGGAVVYDTKQAAELALADRITSLQNINRRGAPRRRF
jgi:hypothetical protein